MKTLILLGAALMTAPTFAEDLPSVYDGPVAIKPLTVVPKIPRSPAGMVCDYEHDCRPEKGGPIVVHSPPEIVAIPKPLPPAIYSPRTPRFVEDPSVTGWRGCMAEALSVYVNSEGHNLAILREGTDRCQKAFEGNGVETFTARADGRRNLGCGFFPIGSDADIDCANGMFGR